MLTTSLASLDTLFDHRRSKDHAPNAADAAFRGGGRRDDSPAATKPPIRSTFSKEIGGPAGPEPTRFGDWEQKGRAIDF